MIHSGRRFGVADVASVEELCEKVTSMTWTLCAGFRLTENGKALLFLNDSISEDGTQEYAVFDGDLQVESLTFGWCTKEQAIRLVNEVLAGDILPLDRFEPRLEEAPSHVCHLCR